MIDNQSFFYEFASAKMAKHLTFHEQIKAARKAQHLTQAALAEKIGCGQSSISYFENGNTGVLSGELIELLGATLGVERVFDDSTQLDDFTHEKPGTLAFCPEPDCPRAWHEVVVKKHVIYPAFFEVTAGSNLTHCPDCGSELETGCLKCLTPLVDNSGFCTGCKAALVHSTAKPEDLEDFVARMQTRHDRHSSVRGKSKTLPASRLRNRVNG
jgi:transcriptional regulator with XRE-family HTH domain